MRNSEDLPLTKTFLGIPVPNSLMRIIGLIVVAILVLQTTNAAATNFSLYTRVINGQVDKLSLTSGVKRTEQGDREIWEVELQFSFVEEILVTADQPIVIQGSACGLIQENVNITGFAGIEFTTTEIGCQDTTGDWSVQGLVRETYIINLYNYSYSAILADNITGNIQLLPFLMVSNYDYEISTATVLISNNQLSGITYDTSQGAWSSYTTGTAQTTNTTPLSLIFVVLGLIACYGVKRRYWTRVQH